jgi:Zn-dependent peptidase ImmA (M78 family)/DNA-binding XRE family transcriptional regulator
MNAETPPRLPYRGKMLRWAREWRGRTVEEAAAKLGVAPDRIEAWENEENFPTVRQARALADFYGRAFLEFFYDSEPEILESVLIPDFRLHRGADDPSQNREILQIQRWAEAQRLNAIELFADIDEAPPQFPDDLFATLDDDVEDVSWRARAALSFTIEQQKRLTGVEQRDLPKALRVRMEEAGVLVLRQNTLSDFGVSGLCIVDFPLPLIVYSAEAPGRSAFTLMHEFAHIVLRESAISGPEKAPAGTSHEKRVERWCDRFAAAFLIPRRALAELRRVPERPALAIDDVTLSALARVFRVSSHAMLIRLVHLRYVDPDFYWKQKRPQFVREEDEWDAGGGRSMVWASRVWNSLGGMYTRLVLEAWGTGRIPFHQAADYMGLKNPSHMNAIRQEFGGS